MAALSCQRASGSTFHAPNSDVTHFILDRVTFASFARSGAEVLRGLIEPQEGQERDFIGVGQLEECRRTIAGRRIDALLIDIGGNDAGFSIVLEDLVSKDSIYTGSLSGTLKALALATIQGPSGDDKLNRDQVERRLNAILGVGLPPGQKGQLEQNYDILNDQVKALKESPGVGEVYITGYPVGLFDTREPDGTVGFRSCEIFDGPDIDITGADARMVKRQGKLLNALIARKAEEFGWNFIDVEKRFEGRGYCSGDGSLWRTAKQSCKQQGDFNGTMHPNDKGVKVWAEEFAESLRTHSFGAR